MKVELRHPHFLLCSQGPNLLYYVARIITQIPFMFQVYMGKSSSHPSSPPSGSHPTVGRHCAVLSTVASSPALMRSGPGAEQGRQLRSSRAHSSLPKEKTGGPLRRGWPCGWLSWPCTIHLEIPMSPLGLRNSTSWLLWRFVQEPKAGSLSLCFALTCQHHHV